jgi:hypothetical protein
MSKPSRLFALVALLVLGVVCGLYLQSPVVAQDKEKPKEMAPAVAKWEYRVVAASYNDEKGAEKELNKLGDEGFEIVFVNSGQVTGVLGPRGGGGDSKPVFHYTLKRAKK